MSFEYKIIFLVSSDGGTLRFIKKCFDSGILNGRVLAVIGDRDCNALDFGEKQQIETYKISYYSQYNQELKNLLEKFNADFIITNIHKLIDPELVNIYHGKLINLHYSLLPAFAGFNAVLKAIEKECKFLGTTVHFVDEKMDNGKIISQNVFPISKKDIPFLVIMDKIFQAGCLNLLNSLLVIKDENLKVISNNYQDIIFSPSIVFNPLHFNETFWKDVKNDK